MASNLMNQIKAKLQPMGSPKLKLSTQSPATTNIQRVTTGKIQQRDRNNSGSPEDSNSSRGNIIQRIQMKNVAFIPAKAQSPISHAFQIQQIQPNITNMNTNSDQAGKISPSRIIQNGNKMVIPANQIKLVKKDGTSPSPEARIPMKLSPTSQQNMNPNISIVQTQFKNLNKNLKHTNDHKHSSQLQQTSDDETTVVSDSEDKVQNPNQMKSDQNQNNFNRPKLNQQQHSHHGQQTLFNQPTDQIKALRAQESARGIKVISQHKIRQSPSPPPNQVLKLQQPPTVTNIQVQMKLQQQQQQQQQQTQPQLATDFIKGMITQSRTNNLQNSSGVSKKNGFSNCLKIKNAQLAQQQQQNFEKDMKKIGLSKDLQDMNQLNQILTTETSPVRTTTDGNDNQQSQQQQQVAQTSKIQHQRNYSPPPNFSQATCGQSPSNVSNSEENQNTQQQEGGDKSVFQFPFQRRARSLSLPKQEIIQSKLGQKQQQAAQQQPQQQSPTQHAHQQQTKSPSPHGEDSRRNKPVVAKINFVIAQKGALGYKDPAEDEAIFERNKEVDEWLMGSGQSDATAGSHNSTSQQTAKNITKQSELEKPIQPIKHNDMDDHFDEDEEEDWMFKTFNGKKGQQANKAKDNQQQKVGRSRLNEQQQHLDELQEFEDPFDMAPELSKQFSSKVVPKTNNFMLEHLGEDCDNLSQYIEKIDEYMLDKIL